MLLLSIRSGDAARRPGATRSPWRLWAAGAGPGAQRECPSQVHNGFCRNDNNRNKRIKSGSGGFRSVRSRDQASLCVLSRSTFQRTDFARCFELLLSTRTSKINAFLASSWLTPLTKSNLKYALYEKGKKYGSFNPTSVNSFCPVAGG